MGENKPLMTDEDNKVESDAKTVLNEESEKTASTGLTENVAGMLCYLGWFITGIIFLVIEKDNEFVRFHAMQSIFVSVILFVVNMVLTAIPIIGWLLGILFAPAILVLWIVMMVKAYQGKHFKLPIIGDLVEKQLNK